LIQFLKRYEFKNKLSLLNSRKILKKPIEEDLDNLVLVAATLCNCPVSLITFLHEENQGLNSNYELGHFDASSHHGIAAQLIKNTDSITVINEFQKYILSSDSSINSFQSPYVFYVGCPLIARNGVCIGSLSIWDTKPHQLTRSQEKSLEILSSQIIKLLEFQSNVTSKEELVGNSKAIEFYENILETNNIGAWQFNLLNEQFKLDARSKKVLGFSEDYIKDFSFDSFLDIIYEDDVAGVIEILNKIKNKGITHYEHEIRIQHKKGYWLWTIIKGDVVKWNDFGDPSILSGSLQDIHDFRTTELQLNSIIENLNCIAFRHIFFKNGTQEIVHITEGATNLFGLTAKDFYDDFENVWKLVHNEDKLVLSQILEKSISSLEEWKHEWRIHHPDGSIRWHKGVGRPVQNKNGSVSIDTVIVDISEDRNKEENLKEINKKLNQAQKIAKLGYWQWDLTTRTGLWTDQVYKIYGIEKTEAQPTPEDIVDTVFPEDWKLINEKRQIAIDLDQELITENRIQLRDGTIKWVRQIGCYVKNSAGTPIHYEGTIQDITESKLVSLALEESIQRYTYVTKATSDAIWDLDFLKGKLYWGENYKKLFGHPSLDSVEDDLAYWESKIHPDDRERIIESFNACIKNGVVKWEEEYRFINVNNEYANVVDRAFVIRNDNGEAIRMVGAIQDVTEKLQAFEEIKRSNERFEKVADATHDAIWDWDLVNDILYQGSGYFKLFGHKILKNKGNLSSWKKFVHPEDLPLVMGNTERMMESQTEEYFSTDYRYLKSDGTYANVIDRGRVIRNKDGEAIRMVGAMQDVTESKMYEESLRLLNHDLEKQARELYHYNEELEQFAYVVSHDLQEPLRMISSFLMLLEKKYNDVLDDEGKKYIHFAVDGAKRMRQIILDLLDFSRVGRTDEELETIDLNELVADVQLIFRQEIENKNAKIQTNPLPVIQNYKILLDQLFQNLIGNALKYQREGEIPIIDISHEDLGTHHQFIVSDNGIGIDSEYFDKIFVIFQRLHGRNQYNGTGIGLALVKKIVDNLQGKIWVESDLNVGSKFIFTIKKNSNY
tara:strand:- start:596 stop:3778 length:3183 start_codon:yes stop_codon:yes gene_type:complete